MWMPFGTLESRRTEALVTFTVAAAISSKASLSSVLFVSRSDNIGKIWDAVNLEEYKMRWDLRSVHQSWPLIPRAVSTLQLLERQAGGQDEASTFPRKEENSF